MFQSLLDEPNPNSPANNLAAKLYQENQREYEKKVKVVVEESWIYCGESPSDWLFYRHELIVHSEIFSCVQYALIVQTITLVMQVMVWWTAHALY